MLLDAQGVAAGYGRVQALWDIAVTVAENEIVALVGPNGAGKTTLLRTLSGMVRAWDGTVTFDGRRIERLPIERIADIGLAHVPEGRRLFAGLSVRDNLRLGAGRRGDRDPERVLELFPKLRDRLGQIAGTMSGGEQQMCAIARGLMARPRLMLIDELSLGLAPVIVDEIMARLPEIAASGTSVLLVEQDVDAALGVASRGYVLETGHIVLSGDAESLLSDPRVQESYLGIA